MKNYQIKRLNDQSHTGTEIDRGVTLRYGPKDYRAKDEADARERVLPIVDFAASQKNRKWQIEQSATGKFFVVANGKQALCETLADVKRAIADFDKPVDKPAPKRHEYIPQTPGPYRTRLLAENAAIDAAEKEQAEADRQSQFSKQIAKELFDLQQQGTELAARERQLQVDLERQTIVEKIRAVRDSTNDPAELGRLREQLYVSFHNHGNPEPSSDGPSETE